jgi:hypothetical protein
VKDWDFTAQLGVEMPLIALDRGADRWLAALNGFAVEVATGGAARRGGNGDAMGEHCQEGRFPEH